MNGRLDGARPYCVAADGLHSASDDGADDAAPCSGMLGSMIAVSDGDDEVCTRAWHTHTQGAHDGQLARSTYRTAAAPPPPPPVLRTRVAQSERGKVDKMNATVMSAISLRQAAAHLCLLGGVQGSG
jgi:hypothetical protein